jgi:hypothetical protein
LHCGICTLARSRESTPLPAPQLLLGLMVSMLLVDCVDSGLSFVIVEILSYGINSGLIAAFAFAFDSLQQRTGYRALPSDNKSELKSRAVMVRSACLVHRCLTLRLVLGMRRSFERSSSVIGRSLLLSERRCREIIAMHRPMFSSVMHNVAVSNCGF